MEDPQNRSILFPFQTRRFVPGLHPVHRVFHLNLLPLLWTNQPTLRGSALVPTTTGSASATVLLHELIEKVKRSISATAGVCSEIADLRAELSAIRSSQAQTLESIAAIMSKLEASGLCGGSQA